MDQDRLERLIGGPWTVHEGNGYTLEQLQDYRFRKHMTSMERAKCRAAAAAILRDFDLVPKPKAIEPETHISERQRAVLLELLEHEASDRVPTFRTLATILHMSEQAARLAVRALSRKGLAKRVPLFDEMEGHVCGSGYMLTVAGRTLAQEIIQKGIL